MSSLFFFIIVQSVNVDLIYPQKITSTSLFLNYLRPWTLLHKYSIDHEKMFFFFFFLFTFFWLGVSRLLYPACATLTFTPPLCNGLEHLHPIDSNSFQPGGKSSSSCKMIYRIRKSKSSATQNHILYIFLITFLASLLFSREMDILPPRSGL